MGCDGRPLAGMLATWAGRTGHADYAQTDADDDGEVDA